MKLFLLTKQLGESEHFETLIKFLNETSDDITFILDCGGGGMHHAHVLVDYINKEPERFTLIGSFIYSAAFTVMYDAKCKKKITRGAIGMFHYPYTKMEIAENDKSVYTQDVALRKNFKEGIKKNTYEWCKLFMTKKELIELEKTNEVFFTTKRLQAIFPGIEII